MYSVVNGAVPGGQVRGDVLVDPCLVAPLATPRPAMTRRPLLVMPLMWLTNPGAPRASCPWAHPRRRSRRRSSASAPGTSVIMITAIKDNPCF